MFVKDGRFKPFEKKVWLATPTMHGEELEYIKEAYTTNCLQYVRELKDCGVRVIFEKEAIDTASSMSEMILTILAAFAQEESRSISENVRQGIRMRYEEGKFHWGSVYGYTKTGQETCEINEEEAVIVRRIFDEYEHGVTMVALAEKLNAEGVPSYRKGLWGASEVCTILTNEKYIGDVLLMKKITVDHITHRQIKNDCTVVPSFYVDNHHDPIVSREQFERVAAIRAMRRQNNEVQYPFGNLLRCPFCTSVMHQRKLPIQDQGRAWCCDDCGGFILQSKLVEDAMMEAAKEKGLQEKELHYWWLDDNVERIEFGAHMMMPKVEKMLRAKRGKIRDDRTMTVKWKDGRETTVSTGITMDKQMPMTMVSLYDAWLERHGKEKAV